MHLYMCIHELHRGRSFYHPSHHIKLTAFQTNREKHNRSDYADAESYSRSSLVHHVHHGLVLILIHKLDLHYGNGSVCFSSCNRTIFSESGLSVTLRFNTEESGTKRSISIYPGTSLLVNLLIIAEFLMLI